MSRKGERILRTKYFDRTDEDEQDSVIELDMSARKRRNVVAGS